MMVMVTVSREFTAGSLAGITLPQEWHCDEIMAPEIGSVFECKEPCFGSPYRDIVIAIRQIGPKIEAR